MIAYILSLFDVKFKLRKSIYMHHAPCTDPENVPKGRGINIFAGEGGGPRDKYVCPEG